MDFVRRAEWGAPATSAAAYIASTRGVKVHYLGTAYASRSHDRCAAYVRSIRDSHLANTAENYSDIAYNMLVCEHGTVFEGRGVHRRTGANGNGELNRQDYAVCALLGSSGLTSPTDAMLHGIRDAIQILRDQGDAGDWIGGHRDGYATSCPGDPLYAWVQKGAPHPTSADPDDQTDPTAPVQENLVPQMLNKSNPMDVLLKADTWTALAFSSGPAAIHGPGVLHHTSARLLLEEATLDPDTRVKGRFFLAPVDWDGDASKRSNLLLSSGATGEDGQVFTADGIVPAGQSLRFEVWVSEDTRLIHRQATGLYWVS